MTSKNKKNWEKEFEAKQFKKWFGFELNTPISGKIVLEEEGRMRELEEFNTWIKNVLSLLRIQREEFIKMVEGKVEAIIANDKTEKYGYSHDARKIYLNVNGEKPPVGERWKTPRELAKDILTKLTKE